MRELPVGVPRTIDEFRRKHPYRVQETPHTREVVKIRPSCHEHDDISDDFLAGMKRANNGGILHLPRGQLFVIGQPLDLTFLNNIHVRIDGEIKAQ